MEENTDTNSNVPITDPAEENILEGDQQEEQQIPESDQEQIVEEQSKAVEEDERPTRGETRQQNYIEKLSEQIRNSNPLGSRQNEESSTSTTSYQPLKYENGEFDADQLEADRRAYGQAQREDALRTVRTYIAPIEQKNWARDLEYDNHEAQKEWSILDEKSPDFDSDTASDLNQKYLNFIGFRVDEKTGDISVDRPNVRITDFMRAEKQIVDRFVERSAQTSTKNIVSQAAKTGIRPSGQSRAPKGNNVDLSDPNWIAKMSREDWDSFGRDLSDREINKRLGIK